MSSSNKGHFWPWLFCLLQKQLQRNTTEYAAHTEFLQAPTPARDRKGTFCFGLSVTNIDAVEPECGRGYEENFEVLDV